MMGNIALITQHIPALQRRVLENFRYVTLRERFSATEGSVNIGVEMLRFAQHDMTMRTLIGGSTCPAGEW
jgi:hypothetical protein